MSAIAHLIWAFGLDIDRIPETHEAMVKSAQHKQLLLLNLAAIPWQAHFFFGQDLLSSCCARVFASFQYLPRMMSRKQADF